MSDQDKRFEEVYKDFKNLMINEPLEDDKCFSEIMMKIERLSIKRQEEEKNAVEIFEIGKMLALSTQKISCVKLMQSFYKELIDNDEFKIHNLLLEIVKEKTSPVEKGMALYLALSKDNKSVAKYLLTHFNNEILSESKAWAVYFAATKPENKAFLESLLHTLGKDLILKERENLGFIAAFQGYKEVVQFLLTDHLSPERKGLMLCAAAGYGHNEIVDMLLKDNNGQDLCLKAKNDALNFAKSKGQNEIAEKIQQKINENNSPEPSHLNDQKKNRM